ncbi:uncharacterized protein UTRI_03388_B [Ustilago trichophora]|uniref:Uncharacterized protein n=1 Tax=Ustilago trichophora TaxID=86804 RepID=A0A5C3E384_9BASI|nr:uncharacterized protein UTRI_03388_B [Ustilago trichophora]
MPTSTTTSTSTVQLFAPGVNQMIRSLDHSMTKLNGDVSIRFSPTPLATTTAPDGAAATVWNVRAHEYASINGHHTTIVEDQKFLESHNYFAAVDQSGAHLECHFDHIGAPATCVNKQPKHHRTFTSTFKHARPFATGYHKHVAVKVHNSTSSSTTQASSSQALPTTTAEAAIVETPAAPAVVQSAGGSTGQTQNSGSSAGSNARMNSTSAASKAKSLPVLLVSASMLFAAVLAFQP